jgi:8-amino-7-oxononanoate synthase
MSATPLRHLGECLADLERRGLLRERPGPIDRPPVDGMLHLCSNDYLGYKAGGRLEKYARMAVDENPTGAGASRLVAGEHAAHGSLERTLSDWLGTQETIVFTSGYAANVGTISALATEGDVIVSDALNHASIIDGCRLSRARCVVVPHNGLEAIREALRSTKARHRWVVTESYFSMEGDSPDLAALRSICDEYNAALIVDEAHALGVLGPGGRGGTSAAGVQADVLIGTLGKALGAQGAFVAGSRELCRYLWNRARSFVFSTGLSPILAAIARGAVEEALSDELGRARLRQVSGRLRAGLGAQGVEVILVQAIRPPTVPARTARLRVTARANLTDAEVDRAVEAFRRVASTRGS